MLADLFAAFAGLGIIGILLVVVASIFWLWMLIDAITNTRLNGTEKIVWVLVVLFLHFVGALVYYFVGRGGAAGERFDGVVRDALPASRGGVFLLIERGLSLGAFVFDGLYRGRLALAA